MQKGQALNNRQGNQDVDHTAINISEFNSRAGELKYRALLSQSSEGIFVFDHRTGKIIESNRQLFNLLGYNEKEFLHLRVQDLIDGDLHRYQDNFIRVVQGEVIQTSTTFKCKNGAKIEVDVSVSLIDCDIKRNCIVNVNDLTPKKQAAEALKRSLEYTNRALEGTMNALITISEKKDPYTNGHQARVAKLASFIAREMNLENSQLESIIIASKVHDLGKINIPTDILTKSGPLSAPEMEIIKCHPTIGYEILVKIPFNYPIAAIVAQHHERWNGTGYPHQLVGEDILFEARILAVADVVEAISSHRPYRPALGVEKALEEIEINSGISYDPQIVKACSAVLRNNDLDLEKILLEE